jgi:hypothetical protein
MKDNKFIGNALSLACGFGGRFLQLLLWIIILPVLNPGNLNLFHYIETQGIIFLIFSIILGNKFPGDILNISAGLILGNLAAIIILAFTGFQNEFTFGFDYVLFIPTIGICLIGYAIGEKIVKQK